MMGRYIAVLLQSVVALFVIAFIGDIAIAVSGPFSAIAICGVLLVGYVQWARAGGGIVGAFAPTSADAAPPPPPTPFHSSLHPDSDVRLVVRSAMGYGAQFMNVGEPAAVRAKGQGLLRSLFRRYGVDDFRQWLEVELDAVGAKLDDAAWVAEMAGRIQYQDDKEAVLLALLDSMADGISAGESATENPAMVVIVACALAMGMSEDELRSYMKRASGATAAEPAGGVDVDDPYAVLGLARGADRATVREAYHRLAQQYHPDKFASMGGDFAELARMRMALINRAYEAINRT